MAYIIDPTWNGELERLRYLEQLSDPGTRQVIRQLGVEPGWNCLEVGAGAGSVARWLASEVTPTGSVVATDINPGFLEDGTDGVEVRTHDIREPGLPDAHFDLAHSRFVLEHLQSREVALRNMIRSLKPGGQLVIECHDHSTAWMDTTGSSPMRRISRTIERIFGEAGADFRLGRKAPDMLLEAGLIEVGAEARSVAVEFGSPPSRSLRLLVDNLRAEYLPNRFAFSDEDLRYLADRTEHGPGFFFTPLVVAAWGRRPVPSGSPSAPGVVPSSTPLDRLS